MVEDNQPTTNKPEVSSNSNSTHENSNYIDNTHNDSGLDETQLNSSPNPYYGDSSSENEDDEQLRVVDTVGLDSPYNNVNATDESYKKPRIQFAKRVLNFFRPYWFLDYQDWSSWKIVIRTWVKAWVCCVLTLIPKVNSWFGQASYLLIIYSYVVPCGGFSIMQSIVFGFICVLFAVIGWIFAIVSMAISTHLRGNHPLSYYVQDLIEKQICIPSTTPIVPNDPQIKMCLQNEIFHGRYLDARCTVIHAVAMVIGLTFFVFVKLQYLPLVFGGVVGIITLMITVTYGLYFPYFQPWNLASMVIRPMGITFAMNVVASILLFPKTSNFAFFNSNTSILKSLHSMVKLNRTILKEDRPSKCEFTRYLKPRRVFAGLGMTMFMTQIDKRFINMEVSYGRFDKTAANDFGRYLSYIIIQQQGFEIVYQKLHDLRDIIQTGKVSGNSKLAKYEQQQLVEFVKRTKGSIQLYELDKLMDVIHNIFDPVLAAADEALRVSVEWLDNANHYRIYSIFNTKKWHAAQQEHAERLRTAHHNLTQCFDSIESEEWNKVINQVFQNDKTSKAIIDQAVFFGFLIRQYYRSVSRIMALFRKIDENVPTPRFIFPSTNLGTKLEQDSESYNPISHVNMLLDPEAELPTNSIQKLGASISRWHHAFGNHNFVTGLRTALLTTLLSFPAFFKSSCWWFYHNRLVWCTIMAALSTFEYLGDTIYGTIANNCYTFISCVIALVGWFIGNGHGTGNYYGMGAVYAVVFFFMTFYRHFSQHFIPLPAIMLCVTFPLVMGTAWNNTHLALLSNIGYGWEPTWKRFVTVVVGLAVGCIASIFPKPFTVKKRIRTNLGEVLNLIGKLHCDVGNFALKRSKDGNVRILINTTQDPIIGTFKSINGLLLDTRRKCQTVQFEPPLQGRWPREKYLKLLKYTTDLLLLYQYLYAMFNHVQDVSLIKEMLISCGYTNNTLSSDFMAILHMCGGSLVRRRPLPMLTPGHTTLKYIDFLKEHKGMEFNSKEFANNVDLSNDKQLMIVARAIMECIYEHVDVVTILTKELVGELYEVDEWFYEPKENV